MQMFARAKIENNSLVIQTEDFKEVWIYPNGMVFAPKFEVSRVRTAGLYDAMAKFLRFAIRGKFAVEEFDPTQKTFTLKGTATTINYSLGILEILFHGLSFVFEFNKKVALQIKNVVFYERGNFDMALENLLNEIVYQNADFSCNGNSLAIKKYGIELARIENGNLKLGDFTIVFGKPGRIDELARWVENLIQTENWDIVTTEGRLILSTPNSKMVYLVNKKEGTAFFVKFVYEAGKLALWFDRASVIVNCQETEQYLYLAKYFTADEREKIEKTVYKNYILKALVF